MGWATRPKHPATLKSAPDFQICRVDEVQHKSFMGMTGLMLREAFPSTSLEDTKHKTESNQHWASNTNQIWETGISTQPCGEPQRHHITWVKLACLIQDPPALCCAHCSPILHFLHQIPVPTAMFRKHDSGEMLILHLL